MNLLSYITGKPSTSEVIFKRSSPLSYLQVKTSLINEGTQVLVICTDFTKIKSIEEHGQRVRAVFFSSVAHELRTPLNSIIPILKMVIKDLAGTIKSSNLLKIVLNSSIHLSNVIEDALDISRLENNNFKLFIDMFKLRETIDEVCEIMAFQIDQKNLKLNL